MIKKYRKKPVVIEAMHLTRDTPACDVLNFMEGESLNINSYGVHIHTLEGTMLADFGDYIIKGVAGEFYPCKPDIFHATYEGVEDENNH